MSDTTETEIKLLAKSDLDDAEVVGALESLRGVEVGRPRHARQRDLYLDDSSLHLARHGIGFRMRTEGDDRTLCWKGGQRRRGALFARQEVERKWSRRRPPRHAQELADELRARIEPIVYRGELEPVVEVRTDRTRIGLHGERARAMLFVDHVETAVPGNGASGSFDEIEIELLDGDPRELVSWASKLRSALPVSASRIDKLQRAMRLCDVAPTVDRPEPARSAPARETCRRFLELHLARMQEQDLAVRVDRSAEPVHKLRVACRRLRSGLRAFEDYLPAEFVAEAARVFGRSARAFGRVRDLDVLSAELIRTLDDLPRYLRHGAARALERLGDERARLHRKGVRKLRKQRRLATLERFQAELERDWPGTMPTRTRTATVAKRLVRDAAAIVAAAEASGEPHALRLALKRLRYTVEVFGAAYGSEVVDFTHDVARLQDSLGILNDATVAEQSLVDWSRREDGLSKRELLAVGAWIGHQRQRRAESIAAFERGWRAFDFETATTRLLDLLGAKAS